MPVPEFIVELRRAVGATRIASRDGIPTTGLRFFTVYGPWGRPDMALFMFTKAILEGRSPFYSKAELTLDTSAQDLGASFQALRAMVRQTLSLPA